MVTTIGIDLNGLSDVSAKPRDGKLEIYRGGDVPSVVVLPKENDGGGRNGLTVIAGEEASRSIEGRGWQWPESAQVSGGTSRRIPVVSLLEGIQTGNPIKTQLGEVDAQDLLGATIEALAGPDAQEPDARVVIAISDDGTYSEEIRQRLLDAAAGHTIPATLLWRSVAAFLGLEEQLRPVARRLVGKKVGVLSLMGGGVQVNCLEIESSTDGSDAPYLVPVRRGPGIPIPYRTPIHKIAEQVARSLMPDDPEGAWQVLWGDGLVLRWLLQLEDRPSLVQRTNGWVLLDGHRPKDLPKVELSDAAFREIISFLGDTRYVIYEGPALEAPTAKNDLLVYHLQDVLRSKGMQCLNFADFKSHLAAKGSVVYAQRQAAKQRTYFDYLPKMRLAVRKGTEPEFVELIPSDARVEGGFLFECRRDLGVSIPARASELKFYLLREGAVAPRYVSIDLPARPPEPLPVSMTLRQRPAQGFAELSLEATDGHVGFAPIAVRWNQMEVRSDCSEDDILRELRSSDIEVPPVVPQPCHILSWTALTGGGQSLADIVLSLENLISGSLSDPTLIPSVKELGNRLTRFVPLSVLTRGEISDRTRFRAVSSDGDVPEPGPGLDASALAAFDRALSGLANCLYETECPDALRSAIVRSVTWTFQRCPEPVLKHLLEVARSKRIPNDSIYYRAMGRCFSDEVGFKAFFAVLEHDVREQSSIKQQRLEGLRYLLSLREDAARSMSDVQSELFANAIMDRLQEMVMRGQFARLTREALRTLAAMLRFRLVSPSFAVPGETPAGDRLAMITGRIMKSAVGTPAANLAKSLLDWADRCGTDSSILQWEEDN